MGEAELIKIQFFQPWHIILYLFVIFVIMVVYYQWNWARVCKNNIQVLVAQQGGGGDFTLSPKTGGQVSIRNPNTNTVKMWAINELSTIEIPYPGVGFVPAFLQKTIRLAIVNEGDWEPMLNRSKHYKMVASPDIIEALTIIAVDAKAATKRKITDLIKGISTSPTREMIASPAVLGNLMHEKITEAIITVNKEMMDQVNSLMRRMNNILSPRAFYIGIGIVLLGLVIIGFLVIPTIGELGELGELGARLEAIETALGVIQGGSGV